MRRKTTVRTMALAGASTLALGIGGALAQQASFGYPPAAPGDDIVQLSNYGLSVAIQQTVGADETEETNLSAAITSTDLGDDLILSEILIAGPIGAEGVHTVSDNTATARAYANRAVTLVDAEGIISEDSFGGTPDGDDPVNGIGIASAQLAVDAEVSAEVSDMRVGGFVEIDDGDDFAGTFAVHGNQLTASASGNDGFTDIFFDGISVQGGVFDGEGDPVAPGSVLSLDTDGESGSGSLDALLGTLSAQANLGTTITAEVHSIDLGVFFVDGEGDPTGDGVAGGTLTVGDNALAAQASGNTTDNAIRVLAAGTFDASAAIASLQVNNDSSVTATAGFDGEVEAPIRVGTMTGALSEGTVITVEDNRVGASATANSAALDIVIEATDLRAGSGLASAEPDFGDEVLTTTGGVTVANAQTNFDTPVESLVGNVSIGALITDADDDAAISGSAVVVSGNAISSSAKGNVADTGLTLRGVTAGGEVEGDNDETSGAFSAAIGSAQYNDSSVEASLQASEIGIDADDGGATGATLSVSDNRMVASARSNAVTNALTIEGFAAAEVGTEDGIGEGGGGIDGAAVNAVFALSSGQQFTGDVSASNTDSEIGVRGLDGIEDGSVLVLSDNVIGSRAQGNVALGNQNGEFGNTISIDVLSLATIQEDGEGDYIAGLSSIQESGADVTASTTGAGIGNFAPFDTEGSTQAVTGNLVFALAEGNIAENLVEVTGSSYSGGFEGDGDAVSSASLEIDREFSLLNVQRELGVDPERSVTATVSDFSIDIDVTSITGSVGTVSGNVVQALARDNVATNVLNIGTADAPFATLATNAAVSNVQETSATVSASLDPGDGGLAFVGVMAEEAADASTLAVNGNQLDARAEGNRAVNVLTASATQMVGGTVGDASTSASTAMGDSAAKADFAVLNNQSNTGPISASVDSARVGVAMGGDAGMTGTLMTVDSNRVNAGAFANTATNEVALASMVGSASAAIGSVQHNGGDVTASVTGVTVGITGGASASATTSAVRGNSITATAAGNTAVNRISRSGY